jgi:hypothetical protein
VVHNVMQKLHQLAHSAIYGHAAWPASLDDRNSVWKMLADTGLTEVLPDGTIRYTDPGASAEIELLVAFIGVMYPWDIPLVLKGHGYASVEEALEVLEAGTDSVALWRLKRLIFRAYQKRAGSPKARAAARSVFVDLRGLLRRSVRFEHQPKPAKEPKKATGQIEMLLPISGKKLAKEVTAK